MFLKIIFLNNLTDRLSTDKVRDYLVVVFCSYFIFYFEKQEIVKLHFMHAGLYFSRLLTFVTIHFSKKYFGNTFRVFGSIFAFHAFVVVCCLFSKNSFRNTIIVSNSLDPVKCCRS